MKDYLSQQKWIIEFKNFISAENVNPPAVLSHYILTAVRKDLDPSPLLVFGHLTMIHFVVGALTLLACPQFGINILPGMGLMAIFMDLGELGCMVACGVVFLGTSSLITALILRPEEVRVLRSHRVLQLAVLTTLSLGVFICLGTGIIFSMGLAWIGGSILGGLITLEAGWQIRSFLRKRLIFGV